MTMKNLEVPGNVLQTGYNVQSVMLKLARPVFLFSQRSELEPDTDKRFKLIKFKAPNLPGGEWLGIATIELEGQPYVGFHKADDFASCVQGMMNRINNGSIQWKEDQYG